MAKKTSALKSVVASGSDGDLTVVSAPAGTGNSAADVATENTVAAPVMRKKDLVDRVVKRTEVKKKEAREIIDAVLDELGLALTRGDELNLPPLGKAKVNRQRDLVSGEVLIVKLRRPGPGQESGEESADAPLADADE
jgi:DNA-binding protein HU-alpha